MRNYFRIMCACALAGCIMTGCVFFSADDAISIQDTEASENEMVIGYIGKELTQPWASAVFAALEYKALEMGADAVLAANANMSDTQYLVSLDNMITNEVDVLIVCPPNQELSQITVERCEEADILLMSESIPLYNKEGQILAPVIMPDYEYNGTLLGEWLAQYIAETEFSMDEMGFLSLDTNTVYQNTTLQEETVSSFLQNAPQFPLGQIFRVQYDGTSQDAFDASAAVITANPSVKFWVVAADNAEGAQSAGEVLVQSGRNDNAVAVCLSGYIEVEEVQNLNSILKASVQIEAQTVGEQLAQVATEWEQYNTVPWENERTPGQAYGQKLIEGILVQVEERGVE